MPSLRVQSVAPARAGLESWVSRSREGKRRMSKLAIHCSSASQHWATPDDLLLTLAREFRFNYDPCPLHSDFDGLALSWKGRRVFCNPPYGPKIRAFLERDLRLILLCS